MLTMTDCSDVGNRVQARYELDRCEVNDPGARTVLMGDWAMKWGRALLDAGVITDDDVQDAVQRAENEATELESRNDTLAETIQDAIKALDELDFGSEYRKKIDAIIVNLERPL